jgi:hypothetical protein
MEFFFTVFIIPHITLTVISLLGVLPLSIYSIAGTSDKKVKGKAIPVTSREGP